MQPSFIAKQDISSTWRTSAPVAALVAIVALSVPQQAQAHVATPAPTASVLMRSPLNIVADWLSSFFFPSEQPAPQKSDVENEKPPRFADIGGYHDAKAALQDVIDAFEAPERLAKLGVRPPRGVLLVGPPGTGKTLLARALATEANVNFIVADGPEFNDMYVGVGQVRLRKVFAYARKIAPVIVFIDEIDAIGAKRGQPQGRHDDKLLNQLLVELDGFGPRSGVVVVAATNRADILDPALTRSGRLDRRVNVGLPDAEARRKILRLKLAKVSLADDVDFELLADMTEGLSGADIANWVSIAAMHAVRQKRDFVTAADFESGTNEMIFGVNEKVHVSEEAVWRTCVHEAGHALVGSLRPGGARLIQIVVDARGKALGYTSWAADETQDQSLLESQRAAMARMLGGLAAEQVLLGKHTVGVSDDLDQATKVAELLVTRNGLGDHAGSIYLQNAPDKPWQQEASKQVYEDIRQMLRDAEDDARQLLSTHQTLLENVASVLLEKKTLSGPALRKMIAESQSES